MCDDDWHSVWHTVTNNDFCLDPFEKTVEMLVIDNVDCGNLYVTLTFDQIIYLYDKIKKDT